MRTAAGAFIRQSATLAAWAAGLDEPAWMSASSLPRWSVRDLVAHIVVVHESLLRTLPQPAKGPARALGDYVATYSAHAEQLENIAQTRSAALPAGRLQERFAEVRAALVRHLDVDEPAVVESARGPISRLDFVRTRVLELVVHSDDLARSLPDRPGPTLDPQALAVTVAVLLEARAHQHPGATQHIEVPGIASCTCAGAAGRFELEPIDALRVFTGRQAPESVTRMRTDPGWGPVLA